MPNTTKPVLQRRCSLASRLPHTVPADTSLTKTIPEVLRDHGLGFCTLTKAGTRAIRDLELSRRDRDAFATTLTSLDDAVRINWETAPQVASPRTYPRYAADASKAIARGNRMLFSR